MYAVITGASSGLGKEFAKQLARQGYNLIIAARRIEKLQKLKKEVEFKYGIEAIVIQSDLSKEDCCYKLFEACLPYDIKVFINNAGFGKVGRFTDIPLQEELEMIQTNIKALHIMTKLFTQHMDKGYILNVSSIAGFQPTPKMSTYGATKAYVLNFSRAVNYEMKRQKKEIHIATLCPGPVATEFNKVANAKFHLKSISASRCVSIALKELFLRKELIVPGNDIKILRIASHMLPQKIALPIEYLIQSRKIYESK